MLSLLVLTVVVVMGVLNERQLQKRLMRETVRTLKIDSRMTAFTLPQGPISRPNRAALQKAAIRASQATGARVTLIDTAGDVIADSDVPKAQLDRLDNHATRPEVQEAMLGRVGQSSRFSQSIKRTLVYYAIPYQVAPEDKISGVIRLSLGIDRVNAAVRQLRLELLNAAVIGLLASIGLSFALSLLTLRPIRELAEVVSDIAAGQLGRQLHWGARDERGAISRSINRMAQQMREQLAEAESERGQLDSVLSSMAEGVLVVGANGRIILANPRLREFLEAWGDIEGRLLPEVVRNPHLDQALREASLSEGPVVRELEIRAPQPRILLLHAERFPKDGERVGTVIVINDVTDVRRVDKVRRDFIANASHELRTPLTAIQGFADTLATGDIDAPQQQHYLEVIARNAQRMSDLIEDLLALSRIEQDGFTLEIAEIDLQRIAEMTLSDFEPRFEKAGLALRFHAEPCPLALADRRAVEQILTNLLSNAARYTNEGGHVDLSVSAEGDRVMLHVKDDGIGIPEHSRERIFERFYRVDAARSRAVGSTGLGLAIVKHLVSQMHGDISVESELEQGSCFTVSLPSAEADNPSH
ncbi:MAG: ATP-binding protein [Myxococcota bacterium]|nr:ATP-binding protein [Myxococcota bacterium]